MKTSQSVYAIYLKSLTIRERHKILERIQEVYEDGKLENKVNHWKLQVGEASEDFYNKRLEWSNIKKEDITKILNPIKTFSFENMEIPLWIRSLKEFQESNKILEFEINIDNIPFKDVLIPLVNYFFTKVGDKPNEISESAFCDLKQGLLSLFSKIASQSLLESMYNTELSYKNFVNFTIKDNYETLFLEYSYLARLLFIKGMFWVENTTFLFKSLRNDVKEISKKLKEVQFKVMHINTELSESHNKGKNISILETESNKFVFKYRSVDTEEVFFNLLDYLNYQLPIKQYVPWLIKKNGYGWMEYIKQKECASISEIRDYYERIGSLLCLFYLLGTTDLHGENLISKRSYPVFIDLETLLNPLTKLNNRHINKLNEFIDYKYGLSVSRIGILPQWLLGPNTNVYNNSGLGGSRTRLRYPNVVWKNINKDHMGYEYEELNSSEDKNLVYLGSKIQGPAKYTSEIVKGFSTLYNYLIKNKVNPNLLKKLESFANVNIRFVFRATKVYTLLLDYMNHPDYMRDGVVRSLEMEIIAKGFMVDLTKKYIFWDILNDELNQLENNDIPYYTTNTTRLSLSSMYDKLYKSAFQYKGYERLLNMLKDLNTDDLGFQVQIIKTSVETNVINKSNNTFTQYVYTKKLELNIQQIQKTIFDIGQKILESTIEIDGRSTWVSYVSNIVSHTYGYKPIGLDISNGNMGVALFIGALYAYSNERKYKHILNGILLPITDVLNKDWAKKEFMLRFGTGGTTGVASIIYGFTKLYELTSNDGYLEDATNFANIIDEVDIEKSIRQDVVSGNAGLLLALLKLFDITQDEKLLVNTERCYKRILKTGYVNEKFVNWDYQQNRKLLGFSHGSSGVLFALSRYYTYLEHKDELKKIFKDIMRYENFYFEKEKCNWPDFRFEEPDLDVVSWCHGATGIGMSRLELLNQGLLTKRVIIDIERAINKTMETGAHFLDTVCCGNSSRLDFILELRETRFYNQKLKNYSYWLINNMLKRYAITGDFKYFSKFQTKDINVGFFQGISGIGYQLLRYVDPEKFGSVVLFR